MTRTTFRFVAILLFVAGLSFAFLPATTPGTSVQAGTTQDPPPQQRRNPFDTGGQDDKPAGEVFKNVQALKGLPAGRLATVMNTWGKVLGVKCNHCHTPGQWDKDDIPAKQVARDMVKLVIEINNNQLKNIKNLSSERPSVSCWTCHRGQAKPETSVPAANPNQ